MSQGHIGVIFCPWIFYTYMYISRTLQTCFRLLLRLRIPHCSSHHINKSCAATVAILGVGWVLMIQLLHWYCKKQGKTPGVSADIKDQWPRAEFPPPPPPCTVPN